MKKIKIIFFLLTCLGLQAQEARKKVLEGNKAYAEGSFDQAEIKYRKAMEASKDNAKTTTQFNLGNALYKQERWQEAREALEASLAETDDPELRAEIQHNLGNTWIKEEKLDKAIEAYKQSLKNNPADDETRYNLAKALAQKKKQEEQKKQNQEQKDQDKKKQEEKDKKDKKDQEKKDQDQQKKDQQDKKDQEKNKQNPKDQKDQKKDPSQGENSQEQKKKESDRKNALRLLESLDRSEEDIQKKLMRKKIKSKPSNSVKDW